ncbi:MAG TPA: hypothetical protein DCM10_16475, partial [Xanthomarina gelatinilytica]|nr:hypothetical protein [Xanthomarina gelatinilytica]
KEKDMSKKYYFLDLNALVVSEEAMTTINKMNNEDTKTFLKKLVDRDHIEIVNVQEADDDDFVDDQTSMIDNYLKEKVNA